MEEKINRGYKYRAYPISVEVENYFRQCFGADRKIYNLHVAHLYDYLEKTGYKPGDKLPSLKATGMPTVAALKKDAVGTGGNLYLYEVDAFASNEAKQNFNKAVSAFNKKKNRLEYQKSALKRKKTLGTAPTFRDLKGMPKFHSRKNNRQSYTTFNQGGNIQIKNDVLYLPVGQKSKLKEVGLKLNLHRPLPKNGEIKNVTVSMDGQGKFTVSLNIEYERPVSKEGEVKKILGLDYSQSNFYVDSEGRKANYPRYYRKSEKKLKAAQRRLSKRKKHSKRWERQRKAVSRLQTKTANQRLDWVHKKSYQLAHHFDLVVVEDLDLRLIGQAKGLAKSQQDNGFGYFRTFLAYKLSDRGKVFLKADKYFPSTQKCSDCGCLNKELKDYRLREWVCPGCGSIHDRDLNAARNLKWYGERAKLKSAENAA
jgi:putative transposase